MKLLVGFVGLAFLLLGIKAQITDEFAMAYVHSYDTKDACGTETNPHVIGELSGYDRVVEQGRNPILFKPGACVAFSLSPLVFVRVGSKCENIKLYSEQGIGCLTNEVTNVNYNICGQDASLDKPDLPWLELGCSNYVPGEVVEYRVFAFGCSTPVGIVSLFGETDTCLTNENGQGSFEVQATAENVTLVVYENSPNCTTGGNGTFIDPKKCQSISDFAPGSNLNQGIKAFPYKGPQNARPLTQGAAETIASLVVGSAVATTIAASAAATLGGGVGGAGGAGGGGGGGANIGAAELILSAQLTAIFSQMELPEAPPEYTNFASSLGWTLLTIPGLSLGGADGGSRRRLIVGDIAEPLTGVDAYLVRQGIPRQSYFTSVLIVYVLLHIVAAGFIGGIVYFKGEGKENAVANMKSASMNIALIMFYPILCASLFQFSLTANAVDQADFDENLPYTILAGFTLFIILVWIAVTAKAVCQMEEETIDENPNQKKVYSAILKKYKFPRRAFFLVNIGIFAAEAVAVIFIRFTPLFVQPGIILVVTFLGFIFMICLRPYNTRKENVFAIALSFLFFLSALIPCLFAVEPVLFDTDTMALLGTIELILNLACVGLTSLFVFLETVPRLMKWVKKVAGSQLGGSKLEAETVAVGAEKN